MKTLKHIAEAIPTALLWIIFRILPIDAASWVGGTIAKYIGPKLGVSQVARKNIKRCFPNITKDQITDIVNEMWDNLGRIIGEMPHIMRLSNAEFHKRIKIIGDAPQNNGRSSILVSGHLGNFEIPAKLSLEQKLGLHLIYRKANNPFVDALIRHTREIEGHPLIPKGQAGMRQIVDLMANNQNIGMLIDQKMDNGIDTLFFGTSVQTTSLPAKLALKYKARIIFTFMPRTQGAYFEVHFKELVIDYDQDDELQITQRINDELEKWVTQYPSQWFWIHNRWKK